MDRVFLIIGSIVMFIAVGAGAFGAHGLSGYFALHPELEATYDTAIQYLAFHGLAILIIALAVTKWPGSLTIWSGYFFLIGILIFSGSLFLLVFTRIGWFGAITPIGGFAFLAGWLLLAAAAWRGP